MDAETLKSIHTCVFALAHSSSYNIFLCFIGLDCLSTTCFLPSVVYSCSFSFTSIVALSLFF
ncbi:hypothetical protein J3Q64DRAFT_1709418 [Phycomyces blakesleeanus]|uniref:Uncharacterized protein n=1 Tax=Phycomyces blakesleeanus TaxID=4837 RepID=A0ABR3BD54_PHYBL